MTHLRGMEESLTELRFDESDTDGFSTAGPASSPSSIRY
jgi:hypothetical protein